MPHATASQRKPSSSNIPALSIPNFHAKRDLASVSSPSPTHAQVPRKFVKRSNHFLQLPREIRDMIYNFVFPGALVAIGNFRLWVPEGKPYMIGTSVSPSGYMSRYLRCYDLPLRELRGMWYTMMTGPETIRDNDYQESENDEEKRVIRMANDNNVDLAASMSDTLMKIRKTMAHKLPLIRYHPQRSSASEAHKDAVKEPGSGEQAPKHGKHRKRQLNPRPFSCNTALLFVSRQTHDEFAEIVYPNSVFAFGSPRLAEKFMTHAHRHQRSSNNDGEDNAFHNVHYLPKTLPVSRLNLATMRFICLDSRAEGRSTSLTTLHMQQRYYDSWTRACVAIARTMNSLTDISVFVDVPYGGPYRLTLDAPWAQPWFALAESQSLRRAAVYLCAPAKDYFTSEPFWDVVRTAGWTWQIDERALEVFAEMIRRCILGWNRDDAVREMMRCCRTYWPDCEESWRVLERWNTPEHESIAA